MSFRLGVFRALIFEKLFVTWTNTSTFTFNNSRQISMSESEIARVMDENGAVKKRKISSDSKDLITSEMEDNTVLRFHKLSEFATKPTRGSPYAAGLDLYSARDVVLSPHGKLCVPTDIQISIPKGCYGRVAPRSGLALKHHIDVGAGVIDYDYRGNVCVVMFNLSDKPFEVKVGDRVAQLILERIFMPTVTESEEPLPETERGSGGFGSTGGFQAQNGNETGAAPGDIPSQNDHSNETSVVIKGQKGHSNGAPDDIQSHEAGGPSNGGSGDAAVSPVAQNKVES